MVGLTLRCHAHAQLCPQFMACSDLCGNEEVILSFFRHGEEGVFERHRSRISIRCLKHHYPQNVEQHLTDLLGISEQVRKCDLGMYEIKLYRLAKSSSGKTLGLPHPNAKSIGNGASAPLFPPKDQ